METFMDKLLTCIPKKEDDDAKTYLHRIISYFQSGLSIEDRRVALHTLFREEEGIQAVLSACVKYNMKKLPSDILSFFSFLLETYPTSLEYHIVVIKDECLSFIRRDSSSADEKAKALEVLTTIVRLGPWNANIGAPAILSQLATMASHRVSKPTVLCKVYGLIGSMAEHMPQDVQRMSERLLKSMMMDLDYQLNLSANIQNLIIEGCCDGLSGFLVSFPLNEESSPVDRGLCSKISDYIKRAIKAYKDRTQRTAGRAALNLLARHGDQLQASLISDSGYRDWHKVLRDWLPLGKEERAVAKQALLTFYYVLSTYLSRMKRMDSSLMDKLKFFSDHFKSQFEKSEDVDIAVKGFGLFAKPMKMYLPEELPGIFNILSQRSQEECGKGNHHRIADYLDSLSVLCVESGIIHGLQLAILEKLSVELLSQFAREEHPTWQTVMIDAVICTLLRLNQSSGHVFNMYLKTFVYQGIIRSVSHPLVEDAEILQETEKQKLTTYRNYVPFWQSVITLNRSCKGKSGIDASLSERRDLSRKIIDRVLESVIEIVSRLDLSLKENVSSELIYHCDVKKCIEANNPLDFTVLVNLVNFTFDLLSNLPDLSHIEKWISPLIKLNIMMSTKHPLVSSFYKFLTCVILIAEKLDYFGVKTEEMEDVEWKPTVNLLSGFLHDVITRQTQYRDELQVACLRLMLSTPSWIAKPLLRVCVTAFQSVFRIGCSMLSLAQEGLRTLARWNHDIPGDKMKILLKAVLPSFDILLQTKDNVADEDVEEDTLGGMAMVKKVLQDKKKKRLWKQKVITQCDTELVQLQKEVILFLSTLDSSTYLSLLDGSEDRVGVTAWQKEKLLIFPLPFPDMKVDISLDDILPRLVDLASNCSDRQTRSVACELLHAVIMFMLGKEKQLESNQQGHLTALWTHVFPSILTLACDMDSMVKQLFAPLGEEMAHWYSSKSQERSKQASAFLEALLEGITHQTDAALRDYSAGCLHEYTLWSKKQGRMVAKVEPVIKFISSLCHHPCPQKRMGAALAFNSLYTVLREDERILDEFWIELLHSLVTSFSMCSMTGDNKNTEVQTEKSLEHIYRVLKERSHIFNMDSKNRRIPKEIGEGNLLSVMRWMLRFCTALNSSCRRSCMSLVDRLSGCVTGCCSANDLILKLVDANGENCLLEIAEGDKGLATSSEFTAWDQASSWVYSLLASMESYSWLIGIGIPTERLLTMAGSNLIQALMNFSEKVVESPVNQNLLWRPKEIENFNVAKCCTVVRMIEYLTCVLEKGQIGVLDPLWSSNFWQILTYCCIWPSFVGFDSTSKAVEENLPSIIEKFLKTISSYASQSTLMSLKEHLKDHVSSMATALTERFPDAVRNDNVSLKDKDFVRGLRVLHSVFQEAQNWSGLSEKVSLKLVFDSIVEPVPNNELVPIKELCAPVSLSPLALEYTTSMLQLYFTTSSDVKPLILLAGDTSHLYRRSIDGNLTHGEHFVVSFNETLVEKLLKMPSTSIEIMVELLSPDIHPQNLMLLPSVLKFHCRPKSATWNRLQEFIESLFSSWRKFVEWASGDSNKENWLISLLVQIVQLDYGFHMLKHCEVICSWIEEVLTHPSKSLAQKTDLLHCLPIICSHYKNAEVKALLQSFKEHHFPLQSSEFKAGTEEHSNFKRAFEVLLKSMIVTGSCVILQMVIKMMTVDEEHTCRDLLPATLESFQSRLAEKPHCQFECLQLVFSMFDEEMLLFQTRFHILQEFLLKLFMFSSLQSQKMFAKFVIKKLLSSIKSRVKIEDTTRVRQRLVSQVGSWTLLQHIYGIPERSLFETPGSELVLAAFEGCEDTKVTTGKELTTYLTRRAMEAFQNPPNCEKVPSDIKELSRKYLCAVYNTCVTFICNLKTEPTDAKFYDKFLFDETSKKIWCLLVDEHERYLLPYCETEHLKNVEKVTSIRQKLTEDKSAEKGDIRKTLQFIESQSFAGSLETDITRFDFSHSRLLKAASNQEYNNEKTIINLEGDSLNNHECMATVCGVIRHLVNSAITPVPSIDTDAVPVLPGWMNSLKNSLLDQTCPKNSLVFLLRVIINCESYFAPYAMHWIPPVLDCIVRTCLTDRISYLFGDLICLIAKWNGNNPSVKIAAGKVNKLFHYLVSECPSTQQSVFKYHLELIRNCLIVWKDYITPPYDTLEKLLNYPDKKVGINLTAIMLFYGLIPWRPESKKRFLSFLMNNLRDSKKTVFKASSELIGLCLKQVADEAGDDQSVKDLVDYLTTVHSKERDCDRFLTVLYGVHENFPQIADSFIPVIRFYLDQTYDDRKALCLCLLSKHLDSFGENPFKQLKEHNLLAMLSSRNSKVQMKALGIICNLVSDLADDELYEVIQEISNINSYVQGEARQLLYEIALASFDRCTSRQETGKLSEKEEQIYSESKALLLLGLVDSNMELQKKCFLKWTQEERLPSGAPERLTTMFSLMYSPMTEEHFLSYCVPLMLQGTAVTPDFQSPVFAHGLDECTFQNQDIIAHWRAKNGPMAPMFAQSMASHLSFSDSYNSSFNESTDSILATQDSLMFEPTADFVDGSFTSNQLKFDGSMLQSSFLFSSGEGTFSSQKGSLSRKQNFKQGLGFGTERLRFVNQSELEAGPRQGGSSRRANRYIGKDSASKVFGMANVRKAKQREEMWKNRARKRESQVKVYRKYRKGDFPDIQIKFADFVNPLMELAKRDTIIAKKVIVNLFTGVKSRLQALGILDPFQQQALSLLKNILEMSTVYSPSAIGACLEIAYHCQFNIDSQLVSEAAIGSDLRALGVLLLESNTSNNEEIWLQLAELYDGLGERDVAHAIMLHNVDLNSNAKLALEAHAEEQWPRAKQSYFDAIDERGCDNFYESCFECMAIMSEWGSINKVIREEVKDDERGLDKLWDDRWSIQNLLPRLLHSEVLNLIHKNKDEHQFLKVISMWLGDKVKGEALQENFCETLSILFLLKKQYVKSQFFGSKALSKFIDDWNDLNPLFRKRRETLLMSLQNIAEVMVFFSEGECEEIKPVVDWNAFLTKLQNIMPVAEDSLMQWETRISFRIACMRQMPEDIQSEVHESSLKMLLSLAEVALLQGNQVFAKKYLNNIKTMLNNQPTDNCLINTRLSLAKCRERHLWSETVTDSVKRLDQLIHIWQSLDTILADTDKDKNTELIFSAHSADSNLSYSILQLIDQESLDVLEMNSTEHYVWLCSKLMLTESRTSSDFATSLENIGLVSLVHSLGEIKHQMSQEMLSGAYLQIAQYCRKILEGRTGGVSTDVTFTRPMVKNTLSAMKCGSSRARQLFPMLLQLPNLSTDLANDFKDKSASVPAWMFLGWIPQMLALLDTDAVNVVGPLLVRIAEQYPNAVTYPYNISRGNNLSNDASKLRIIKKLDCLLGTNSVQTQLVRALSCLTHPSIILKDHVVKLSQAVSVPTAIDWNAIEKIIGTVFEEVLNDCCGRHPTYKFTGKFFSSLEDEKLHQLFMELCDAVKTKSKPSFDNVLKKISEACKKAEKSDIKNIKPHSKLKDFSRWLAEFSSSKMNVSIEIPGQYTGDQKPTPERHVMISRFEENVQVMQSLRKPVKLTIIGSNSTSNTFLVKYGEDLRQDERVQQLLCLMNGVFAHNQVCRERHLSVLTYKVVPLSSSLGIIGWVDNTSTLKELMLTSLSKEGRKMAEIAGHKHRSWINEMEGSNPKIKFGNAHKSYSRNESVSQFAKLVALTPYDVIRKGLALWSSSAEAFYWLRHSFTTSFSAMCIAHWLLGVGDRHLSNCLISESNGQCIGIDFGHCFGSATQFLAVPELVPFRLTPHIVNVAHPHGTTGLIEETMVRALRALQADPEVLIATMQVFIQEPSLDWLVRARENFAYNEDNPSWLPASKIQQVKQKLKGVNPVVAMREDLESNLHREFRTAYLGTVKGDASVNIRATLGNEGLTARQQVQCLIDLATDENLLVKMWHGWEPWM
ncbi:DNA-dependent protein kinase catalytic subunit-like [Thrips palmi]|uniref:non-specific serine/threonine protein kinase n=1 Tax=Thrips palmi TaxID=161013 RepID=A0A6P8Z5F9_THRPL|nr:DNA-dependent protein kinase catalytic subunit-like [Thrips palmi]